MTRRVRTMVVEPWSANRFTTTAGRVDQACGTGFTSTKKHATGRRGYTLLQQARGTEARNRIRDRNCLSLKYPAGHRIAQGRIANID